MDYYLSMLLIAEIWALLLASIFINNFIMWTKIIGNNHTTYQKATWLQLSFLSSPSSREIILVGVELPVCLFDLLQHLLILSLQNELIHS